MKTTSYKILPVILCRVQLKYLRYKIVQTYSFKNYLQLSQIQRADGIVGNSVISIMETHIPGIGIYIICIYAKYRKTYQKSRETWFRKKEFDGQYNFSHPLNPRSWQKADKDYLQILVKVFRACLSLRSSENDGKSTRNAL